MSALDIFRYAMRSMQGNRLRSALTTLGIIIGVASVVVMVAVGAGTQAAIKDEIERLGASVVVVTPGSAFAAGAHMGAGTRPTLSDDDAIAVRDTAAGISAAAPSTAGAAQLVTSFDNWSAGVQGVTEDYFAARDRTLDAGRLIDDQDVETGAKVVMLGATTAEKLFPDEDPIGRTVRVNTLPMEVIGLLGRKGQTMDGSDLDDLALVPLSTARDQLFGRSTAKARSVSMITIKVTDQRKIKEGIEEVREVLRFQHRLAAAQPDDFRINNIAETARAQEESSAALTKLLAAIASISLLVGGIGIMNIMLVSVTERTREIGIRMAIGAKPAAVMIQFLTEATILSVAGGIAGAAIGFAGAVVAETRFGMRIELTADPVMLAFLFSALVGVVFGMYPAIQASRKSPLEALRYE
ncbi:ABC transporter permease [Mesorhizobium abyssinicae]|uniref:ABC transporter permease n=1 Tax=Mesorhizobium abyssinicae TaxID=1209958 RepID=UPI002A24F1AF|nr:ABC transporter permease [Mesorhizobium abyssinicae]MDX8437571.1 ABC transporter permease [Mesorhizobium abyssinicae]